MNMNRFLFKAKSFDSGELVQGCYYQFMKNPSEIFEEATQLRAKKKCLENEVLQLNEEYNEKIKDYRIASVCMVLNFVRSNRLRINSREIDTLLCHCQNKLVGNIDGVELDLDDHFFVKR